MTRAKLAKWGFTTDFLTKDILLSFLNVRSGTYIYLCLLAMVPRCPPSNERLALPCSRLCCWRQMDETAPSGSVAILRSTVGFLSLGQRFKKCQLLIDFASCQPQVEPLLPIPPQGVSYAYVLSKFSSCLTETLFTSEARSSHAGKTLLWRDATAFYKLYQ